MTLRQGKVAPYTSRPSRRSFFAPPRAQVTTLMAEKFFSRKLHPGFAQTITVDGKMIVHQKKRLPRHKNL